MHFAVALGHIEATKHLLEIHSNIHARDAKGHGILAAGNESLRSPDHLDPAMHGRIVACMALAVDAGAISNPTFSDEWSIKTEF